MHTTTKALPLLGLLSLILAGPAMAADAAPKPAVDPQTKAEMEALHTKIQAEHTKLKAARDQLKPQAEKLKAAREQLKPQAEQLRADREKMRAMREKARAAHQAKRGEMESKMKARLGSHKGKLEGAATAVDPTAEIQK